MDNITAAILNVAKNNANKGVSSAKFAEQVKKLLKKNKVSYKSVNKDTILDLIIATEKKQNVKIFGLFEDNQTNKNINNDKNDILINGQSNFNIINNNKNNF